MHPNIFTYLKRYWMFVFLGIVLILTIGGMIVYQLFRQDPITVVYKDAQGYLTTQILYKHPNETVQQVISRTNSTQSENYVCNIDLDQKISTIDNLTLVEKVAGTITIDDTVIPFESGAETIQQVLNENEINISPVDIISPLPTDILTSDTSNIVITRVSNSVESITEVLPYVSQTVENENLPYNEVNVIQEGRNGVRSYTQETVYNNGEVVETFITSDQRTEPVNEVIEIGTSLTAGKPNIEKGDIEAWRPFVIKALEMNGLSTSEAMVNKVLRQINTESAGDQNAHQEIIDINSLLGEEARGLMQTIPSTFEYYHFEGYDDILNGYHNLLAALNYAKEAYGEDLNGLGEGHGY